MEWGRWFDARFGRAYWVARAAAAWTRFQRVQDRAALDEAIDAYRRLNAVTPHGHPDLGCQLGRLGTALRKRFELDGEVSTLPEIVDVHRRAAAATPDRKDCRPAHLANLVDVLRRQLEITGDTTIHDEIVAVRRQLAVWGRGDDPRRPQRLGALGEVLLERYERSGDQAALASAVDAFREATEPPWHRQTDRLERLARRAYVLGKLIESAPRPGLLAELVDVRRAQVDDTPATLPAHTDRLLEFSRALWALWQADRNPVVRNEVREVFRRVEALTPEGHRDRGCRLSNVANTLDGPADRELLEEILELHRQAVLATPADHEHLIEHLTRFAGALRRLHEHSGSIDTMNELLDVRRRLVAVSSADHPDRARLLAELARIQLERFQLTGDTGMLAEIVRVQRELADLLPAGDPLRPHHLAQSGAILMNRFYQTADPVPLDRAVELLRWAVAAMPAAEPDRPTVMANLGAALAEQAERADPDERAARWREAGETLRAAVDAFPPEAHERAVFLGNLGDLLRRRFAQCGDPGNLREAMTVLRQAMDASSPEDPLRLRHFVKLAAASLDLVTHTGDAEDRNEAIAIHRELVEAIPPDLPDRANHAAELAGLLQVRANPGDLDEAVDIHRSLAAPITPDEPGWRCAQHNLGNALRDRDTAAGHPMGVSDETIDVLRAAAGPSEDPEHRLVHLADLVEALGIRARVTKETALAEEMVTALRLLSVAVTDPGKRARHLRNLGSTLLFLLGQGGTLGDTVDVLRQAVRATPDDHPDRPVCLAQLAAALLAHHNNSADALALDEAITALTEAIDGTPEDDPDRSRWLCDLGRVFDTRYGLGGDSALLRRAVEAYQLAVLSPTGQPELCCRRNALGNVLLRLAGHTGEPETYADAIAAHRLAVAETPAGHRHRASHFGGLGAALFVMCQRRGVSEPLSEAIAVLRHAVRESSPEDPGLVPILVNLSSALVFSYQDSGVQALLDEARQIHKRAAELGVLDPMAMAALGTGWSIRYDADGDPATLDDSIRWARQALAALPAGHIERGDALYHLAGALMAKYERTGRWTLLDEARRSFLLTIEETPAGHARLLSVYNGLGATLLGLYDRTGELAILNEAIGWLERAAQSGPLDRSDLSNALSNLGLALRDRYFRTGNRSDLEKAVRLHRDAVAGLAVEHTGRPVALTSLGSALQTLHLETSDDAPLDESILVHREACTTCPPGHALRPRLHANLGIALRHQYVHTSDPEVLAEAVEAHRVAVAGTLPGDPLRPRLLSGLSSALRTGGDTTNPEAVDLLRQAVAESGAAPPVEQIGVRADWGQLAADTGDWVAALEALSSAVESLPLVVPTWLNRDDQERQLTGFAGIASDAAACALRLGDPRRAVELLEHGRGVLLGHSMARGAEIELGERDPELAERITTLRTTLNHGPVTPELVADWDRLVARIREMPGLERFHRPPAVEDLLAEATGGPIVVINVSRYRSDALILENGDVRVAPLPGLDPDGVRAHVTGFQDAINDGGGGVRDTLTWLWETICGPVLDAIGATEPLADDATGPRVWWSPTGLLSLLPLHAAGVGARTVLDRVISSYTPTVHLRHRARRLLAEPEGTSRTLVVSMPNTPGWDPLPAVQREVFAALGHQPGFNSRADRLATRELILAELPAYSWVHFACHSYTDLRHPSASSLVLHDYDLDPLTALDISGLRLRGARLAVLSGCDTLRTSGELADEAIHLGSAFLVAGYPHVVGTLWSVPDSLGASLVRNFYTRLTTKDCDDGQVAIALHRAVRRLRDQSADPRSWAAYVHTGA